MVENVIPLKEAQNWAKIYREKNPNSVIAYLVPGIDFTQLLKEKNVVNIRAYVGIDPKNGLQKLMLVGVDELGNDLINPENGQFIYDFSKPCPDECAVNSPLFTLK